MKRFPLQISLDQAGQSNIEYILVIGVMLCAMVFIVSQYGGTLSSMIFSSSDKVAQVDMETGMDLSTGPVAQPEGNQSAEPEEDKLPKQKKSAPVPPPAAEPSLVSSYLPYILLVLVFCLMMAILVLKIKQRRMLREGDESDEEDGQAMTETALSLPIVLLFIFAIMQLGLLYHARFMVHLASFHAARTAIVQIPTDEGEGKNKIKISGDDPKFEKILNAARIPCIPISSTAQSLIHWIDLDGLPADIADPLQSMIDGVLGAVDIGQDFLDSLGSILTSLGLDLGMKPGIMVSKYGYAYVCTSIEIMEEGTLTPVESGETAEFTENGPVTVRVNFYYRLSMPLVNALLGKKVFPLNLGALGSGDVFTSPGSIFPMSLKGWFYKLNSTTTLDNEGFQGID